MIKKILSLIIFLTLSSTAFAGFQVIGNLQVTGLGGSSTRCLQTDNSGNVTIASAGCSSSTPGGSTQNVQTNISGSFYGDNNFKYDPSSVTLTLGASNASSNTYLKLNTQDSDDFETGIVFTQGVSNPIWQFYMPAFYNNRLVIFNSGGLNYLVTLDPSEDSVGINSPSTGNHLFLTSTGSTKSYFGQQPSGTTLISTNVDGTENINDTTYGTWRTFMAPDTNDVNNLWGIEYTPANTGIYSPQHFMMINGQGIIQLGDIDALSNLAQFTIDNTTGNITMNAPLGSVNVNTILNSTSLNVANSLVVNNSLNSNFDALTVYDSFGSSAFRTSIDSSGYAALSLAEDILTISQSGVVLTPPTGTGFTYNGNAADVTFSGVSSSIFINGMTVTSTGTLALSPQVDLYIAPAESVSIQPGGDFIVNASAGLAQLSAGGALNIDGQGTAAMTITGITEWAFGTTDITNVSGFGNSGDIFTSNGIGSGTSWVSASALGLLTNPMTTLGDIIYGGSSGVPTRLAGNTTTAMKFYASTGTGSAATAPTLFNLFQNTNVWTQNNTFSANLIYSNATASTFAAFDSSKNLITASQTGTGTTLVANTAPTIVTSLTLSAANLITDTTTGMKIGTGTAQKIGFYNATPVAQISGSTDVLAGLVTQGLRAASSNPPLNLGTGNINSGNITIAASNVLFLNQSTTAGAAFHMDFGNAPTTPSAGDIYADTATELYVINNSNAFYQGGNLYTATAGVTLNSTTPTTSFSGTKIGTTTVKSGSWRVGQKFNIWGAGNYTTPIGNTSTFTITTKVGSTTISTVTTGILPASATNLPFDFNLTCTVQTVGASGKLVCNGSFNYSTALSAVAKTSNDLSTVGQVNLDTTTNNALDVLGSWSTVTTQTATVQQATINWQ